MKKLFLMLVISLTLTAYVFAGKTVTAIGEADIVNEDKASARIQAVARAKWAALEQVAGIKVKADTIVMNAQLVDEAVKTETEGIVKDFKVIGEEVDGNMYRVQIEALIEEQGAKKAMSLFSKNTNIAVMIPVFYPDRHVEVQNPLSERVIDGLISNQMEVLDLAAQKNGVSVKELDYAIKTQNYMAMTNIAVNHLSNTILIGKVVSKVVARKGADFGYGKLPFDVVQGELSYRLLANKDGRTIILKTGTLNAKGQGATVEDATYRMVSDLSNRVAGQLVGIVLNEFKGQNARMVNVRITGKNDLKKLMSLKQILNYTPWVLNVQEQGTDTLLVQYPEKSLYLATAINSKHQFKVRSLSDYEIVVDYNE